MRIALSLALASACLFVASAQAEDPAPAPAEAAQPAPLAPAKGGKNGEALDEVVVTARRREESLQSVPAAVSVVGGEWLDNSYTVNTQSLSQLVPSLYYNSANPRNTAYTIRGLGSNTLSVSAANDGIEPGTGFYVDQVYHGRPSSAAFDFTDIDRVEVLRGPQGTLFGKNTTAGAIHVMSREPSFQREANGEISVGNFDYTQIKGSLSGPVLDDQLAGRISAQLTRRDGVIHNVNTGEDLNALNSYAWRTQLLFRPSETLKLRLIGDVSDLDAACCTQVFLRVGQSQRSPARQFPALAAGIGYEPPSRNVYDRLTDIDAALRINTQDGGLSLIGDWDLGSHLLTSVSAWRYWDWNVANDRDYIGLPIQTVQRIPSRQDQYSQELRLARKGEGPLQYVGGLYFFTQRIVGQPTSIYGPDASYWLLNPASYSVPLPSDLLDGYGQQGRSNYKMSSYAAFGELSYLLLPRLTGTLGLRYTQEDKQGRYATQVFGGADLTQYDTATATELRRAQLAIFRPQSYRAKDDGGNGSGRANLAYQITETVMAYGGYAYGYKSGGINMSGLPLDAQNQPALATAVIKDEKNVTLELGLKSQLPNGRATLNLAAYRTRVKDYQANIVSSAETAALRSYPANIPEVQVQGVEADLAALLFRGFTLRASLAYGDGEYRDYPQGPCPLEAQTSATLACNLTGKSLAGLSKWSETLGLDYVYAMGPGMVVMHSDTSFRSRYNSDTSGSRYTMISGYSVTNASLGYRFNSGWELDVFARNLFDADYIQALTIQTGNSGLILGQPSDPRLLGLSLRTRF